MPCPSEPSSEARSLDEFIGVEAGLDLPAAADYSGECQSQRPRVNV